MTTEELEAIDTARQRLREKFTRIRYAFEDRNVRHPDIGALLEILIDQEVRIDKLEHQATKDVCMHCEGPNTTGLVYCGSCFAQMSEEAGREMEAAHSQECTCETERGPYPTEMPRQCPFCQERADAKLCPQQDKTAQGGES